MSKEIITAKNGTKYHYVNGQLHREDGPAIELPNGYKFWFLYGRGTRCKTQEEFEKFMKLKAFW